MSREVTIPTSLEPGFPASIDVSIIIQGIVSPQRGEDMTLNPVIQYHKYPQHRLMLFGRTKVINKV